MHSEEKYPQHELLKSVNDKSQAIYDFLMWLSEEKDLLIGEYDGRDRMYIATYDLQALLGEFFGIDLKELEREKRAMLEEFTSRMNQEDGE